MDAKEFLAQVLDFLSNLDEDMTMNEVKSVVDRLYMEELYR